MHRHRTHLFALAIMAGVIAVPAVSVSAAPQEPIRIAQAAEPAAKPTVTTRVKVWTRAKWDAARSKFKQDREKWTQCQAELKGKKLKLHASRDFLYDCMNKSAVKNAI